MRHDVASFIVVAPASRGKAVLMVKDRLRHFLADRFPSYEFMIEPFGPFSDEHDFSVVPIMNLAPKPGDRSDVFVMGRLSPETIPAIEIALTEFEWAPGRMN